MALDKKLEEWQRKLDEKLGKNRLIIVDNQKMENYYSEYSFECGKCHKIIKKSFPDIINDKQLKLFNDKDYCHPTKRKLLVNNYKIIKRSFFEYDNSLFELVDSDEWKSDPSDINQWRCKKCGKIYNFTNNYLKNKIDYLKDEYSECKDTNQDICLCDDEIYQNYLIKEYQRKIDNKFRKNKYEVLRVEISNKVYIVGLCKECGKEFKVDFNHLNNSFNTNSPYYCHPVSKFTFTPKYYEDKFDDKFGEGQFRFVEGQEWKGRDGGPYLIRCKCGEIFSLQIKNVLRGRFRNSGYCCPSNKEKSMHSINHYQKKLDKIFGKDRFKFVEGQEWKDISSRYIFICKECNKEFEYRYKSLSLLKMDKQKLCHPRTGIDKKSYINLIDFNMTDYLNNRLKNSQ